ncbi:hypothetical protein CAPTEDRAFT_172544 [Capitella teleta]|uniref:DNA polymerase eta n=1 Tax=Capitella teleta TaxID=283909 RepID=R7U745_CAPTE|nr:hypothetical protein CAPTEDRAFT_172544 [Capitella teleta]|eukprot:ELT99496.1 hypothetical protein CAPTEDRAFT_172544 [Capitella teleta]
MGRVIALVDMDCFYVQVEQRLKPEFKGHPCAVVQYRTYKGGGIIAVGYEARALGVTRGMMGQDAQEKCPNIHLFRVPETEGKADLTLYREAGAEVIEVLTGFSKCVERASIDEAYVDLTDEVHKRLAGMEENQEISPDWLPNTYVLGCEEEEKCTDKSVQRERGLITWLRSQSDAHTVNEHEKQLAVGAVIVEEMRARVHTVTGFRCSAGIASNKMLAKLVCGINKPNKQTLLPFSNILHFFGGVKVKKVRGFGGKFGESVCEQLQVETMGDIRRFSRNQLQECFGDKTGSWLYDTCRGQETEDVIDRQLTKSVGCSKNFRGPEMLVTKEQVKLWLSRMSKEIEERLLKDRASNNRVAKSLHVHIQYVVNKKVTSASRCASLVRYNAQKLADDAYLLLSKFNRSLLHQSSWSPPITCMGISASKFSDLSNTGRDIKSFLQDPSAFPSVSQNSSPAPPAECKNSAAAKVAPKNQLMEFMSKRRRKGEEASLSNGDQSTSRSFFQSYMQKRTDATPPAEQHGDPEETSLDTTDVSDMVTCEKCQQSVSAWEMPEHLDYHFAADLQDEENALRSGNGRPKGALAPPVSLKRKVGETGKSKGRPSKLAKSQNGSHKLHHFFSKS